MVETTVKKVGYESYKDSGVAWLGEIPEHWQVKKIKFISDIYNGDSLNESLKKKYESEDLDDLAYISSKDIDVNNSIICYLNGLRIPKEKITLKVAPKNSSLLCIEGGSAGRKIAFTNQEVCFVNKLACFKIKAKNNSHYLFFSLKGSPFQTQFKLSMSGMIGGVAISSINNFILPIPPLQEQTAIAQFLDDKTTKIDQAIAIKEQQIQLLKERKQILIHKAVTRGLDDNVPLKDSGVEWIGDIPEHWEVKKMAYVCKIDTGATPDRSNGSYWEGSIPWIKTGEVNYDVINTSEEFITKKGLKNSATRLAPVGTLLMAMYGQGVTRGRVSLLGIEATYNQACCAMLFNKEVYNKYAYYFFVMAYSYIRDGGNETSQMNISAGYISGLKILQPPLSEQKEISAYIETASKKIETAITLKQQEIEKLKEYKSSLINSVVSGKINVNAA